MSTLFDSVMEPHLYQQRKHDLGSNYAERQINSMSNTELLENISNALEQRLVALTPPADPSLDAVKFAARAQAFEDIMALIGARATFEEVIDFCKNEHAAAKEGKTRQEWENEL